MFWLLFQFFAAVDGLCDALLYGLLGAESFKWNEHRPLLTRRGLAVAAAVGAGLDAALAGPHWLLWLACEVAACVLSFSLFHNESYNFGRVWIREQDLRKAWAAFEFNYQSPSTTARWDFDGTARWLMAAGAVLVLSFGFILLLQL